MSPYLTTADPQKAPTILTAIAASSDTTQLAQALSQTWTESNPLSDPRVQSAGTSAVQAILENLTQQSSAQPDSTTLKPKRMIVPMLSAVASLDSVTASLPATISVTPYCWNQPNHTFATNGLQCLDLDYISFATGSVAVSQTDGTYGFSPQDCGECTVGWLARVTSLPSSTNPDSITAGSDQFGAESPLGSYDSVSCSAGSACVTAWIEGNSGFQYLDLEQAFLSALLDALQKAGLNPPPVGPVFSLSASAQETGYLVRLYSGGVADSDEESKAIGGEFSAGQSTQLNLQAMGLNLLGSLANGIEAIGLLPDTVLSCGLQATIQDVVNGAVTLGGTTDLPGVQDDLNAVLTDTVSQLGSCISSNALGSLVGLLKNVGTWGSLIGTGVKISGAISNLGEVVQRETELAFAASAVETAIITIAPGSPLTGNPAPHITQLAPSSAPVGSALGFVDDQRNVLSIEFHSHVQGSSTSSDSYRLR